MKSESSRSTSQLPNENRSDQNSESKLDALRRQIDATDHQLVELLSTRQACVNQILEYKKANNLPVYHPAREENLISARRLQGRKKGLNPDYLEELFRCIMRQSRIEQVAHMAQSGVRRNAVVLIVGGAGEMGAYFQCWFSKAGYKVRILDRSGWQNASILCKDVDLVLLSVPIDMTSCLAEKIAAYIPPGCILADIASIKKEPLDAMLKAHKGPVLGLHPLFGPTTTTLDKQIVVTTPGRDDAACQWVLDQFAAWGAILIRATAEEHDEIMTLVQALRHFATFSFGQFLYRQRINLARTLEFSSPIYRLELGMVGRLFAQDAALYGQIIFASPERRRLLKAYLTSISDNLEMLENGDEVQFCHEFNQISKWFGSFSEQAIRESTFLIDKLIEHF